VVIAHPETSRFQKSRRAAARRIAPKLHRTEAGLRLSSANIARARTMARSSFSALQPRAQ